MSLSVSPSFTWTVSINHHKNTITFDLRLFHSVYDRLLEKIPYPIHTNKFYRFVCKMFRQYSLVKVAFGSICILRFNKNKIHTI